MNQQPERELKQLIRSMQPELMKHEYVFITQPDARLAEKLDPVMIFKEAEGVSMIVLREKAEQENLVYEFPCRMITINVHSALDAVGFLAAITRKLASLEMGANAVSAFYHDHLFVPADRAEDAMQALEHMSQTGD